MQVIATSNNIKSQTKSTQNRAFDAQAFLDSAGIARRIAEFPGKATICAQADPAKTVMYIQQGTVKPTVVNGVGKEAVVAVLGPGDFFGEGCLAAQSIRIGAATAIAPTTVLVIEKKDDDPYSPCRARVLGPLYLLRAYQEHSN